MVFSEEIVFKTTLKMTFSKLSFKADKIHTLNKLNITSISKDLKAIAGGSGARFDRSLTLAKIRISKLVTDDNTADIYETLSVDSQLMLSKLGTLLSVRHDRKTGEVDGGDDTVNELSRKMMFAGKYVNVKEYKKLVTLLANKYGKIYYEEAVNTYGEVGKDEKDFAAKCREDNRDELVEAYLREFCDTYKIDLYGDGRYDDDGEGGGGGGGTKEAAEPAETVEPAKEALAEPAEPAGVKAGTPAAATKPATTAPQPTKDSMDDLKKRFEALKRL